LRPADTITAAVNIAHNPGSNVSNLMNILPAESPFQPMLTSANDFTLGVTYNVGTAPAALAVDASNNVWVANSGSNSITRLTPAGVVSSYTAAGLSQPNSIALDSSGDPWVTSSGSNQLFEFSANGGSLFTSATAAGGLNAPSSVAIDGLGMIWVANGGPNTVSAFSNNGAAISGSGYATGGSGTGGVAIAIDPH
jgi:streptogramin lyase